MGVKCPVSADGAFRGVGGDAGGPGSSMAESGACGRGRTGKVGIWAPGRGEVGDEGCADREEAEPV